MTAAAIDPTPREIRQRSAEVQSSWSRRERWKRAGKPPRVTVTRVRAGEIVAAAKEVLSDGVDE
jgi:hypothetical protein